MALETYTKVGKKNRFHKVVLTLTYMQWTTHALHHTQFYNFFKSIFIYVHACKSICALKTRVWVPEEAEAKMLSDPLELELVTGGCEPVTGGCEPPDVNAGNWTHDPRRRASALHSTISLVPVFKNKTKHTNSEKSEAKFCWIKY